MRMPWFDRIMALFIVVLFAGSLLWVIVGVR